MPKSIFLFKGWEKNIYNVRVVDMKLKLAAG